MSVSTVGSLNHSLQLTQQWLKELSVATPFGNEEQAYTGLRAVLHSLRDRLTVEEAVHFAAQLPMVVRGFYYEGWRPVLAPNEEQTPEQFYESVRQSLRNAQFDLDPGEVTRVVFGFLEMKIDEGQVRHVKGQLPEALQKLWPGGPA